MAAPRVVPGDDGAGVIDRVGPGVEPGRVGERVWVHAATLGGAPGTAAELVVVPQERAIPLPPHVSFEQGACLGVPALTAHRCGHADGPVAGRVVLVTGGAGGVGHYAVQLAREAGATVIATASTERKRADARRAGARHVVDRRDPDGGLAAIEAAVGPRAVDRVVDVAFGANLPLVEAVLAVDGVVAAYGLGPRARPPSPSTRSCNAGRRSGWSRCSRSRPSIA